MKPSPCHDFLQLIEARITFRRNWIASQTPKRKQVKPEHIEALNAYDDESNFARMGAEFVDSAWGLIIKANPTKLKALRRPKFSRTALQ